MKYATNITGYSQRNVASKTGHDNTDFQDNCMVSIIKLVTRSLPGTTWFATGYATLKEKILTSNYGLNKLQFRADTGQNCVYTVNKGGDVRRNR